MQKWEYLILSYELGKTDYLLTRINGKTGDYKNYPTRFDYINQLGEQGWEIVAHPVVFQFGTTLKLAYDYLEIVLKRQKQ